MNPILYKEWIKTRIALLLLLIVSAALVAYAQMRIGKVITLRGASHLWEILLTRDNTFLETLTYLPVFSGIVVALFQFLPEMQQKRLKLTLHLPVTQNRIIVSMLLYGVVALILLFALQHLFLWLYFQKILAVELTKRILLTTLPWYVAGIAGYAFTAWVCIEPAWRRRLINALFGVAFLRLFFLVSFAEAYNGWIVALLLFSVVLVGFSYISVQRFKDGVQ